MRCRCGRVVLAASVCAPPTLCQLLTHSKRAPAVAKPGSVERVHRTGTVESDQSNCMASPFFIADEYVHAIHMYYCLLVAGNTANFKSRQPGPCDEVERVMKACTGCTPCCASCKRLLCEATNTMYNQCGVTVYKPCLIAAVAAHNMGLCNCH
jgi:hypothetical protein